MFDIVALGESLIDFTPSGVNEFGVALYGCNPGGAPANVLAMNAKLGGHPAFIGKVGEDGFGAFLEKTMKDAGIDVSGLVKDKKVHTTLAFVQLDETGDRSFSFYRKPGADICLEASEVKEDILTNSRIFHFGSLSFTDEPVRSATIAAVEKAKAAGAIISYDPNYRPALWDSEEQAAEMMKVGLKYADILKVAKEEMELLTGESDIARGSAILSSYGARLVMVTDGANGSYFHNSVADGHVPAFKVKVVDTNGSGDAFWGALLYRIADKTPDEMAVLTKEQLTEIVTFANAAGGLTATAHGAIPAMPNEAQIRECVRTMEMY